MENPEVDAFLSRAKNWQAEMTLLRLIALECGLTEELKWRQPCYNYKGNNIIIIGAFKAYCIVGFFKGVLLGDPENLLTSPGENSQTVKQLRFTGSKSIEDLRATIKAYIFEAVEIEKTGLKVEFKKSKNLEFPQELLDIFKLDPIFNAAFNALTPGRQRGYNLFFTGAKQSETRTSRIEKYKARILTGKGINDCVCGHSKKMPGCDGSHKYL